jgi:hypothetical protein
MNPELRRLLWLEAAPGRLVLVPSVLGLLLAAVTLADGRDSAAETAYWAAGAIGVVWGPRLAAQSLLAEIAGNTWDGQRTSALSAWQMTFGKLAGATAVAWYGFVLAMLGAALLDASVSPPRRWIDLALVALIAQAAALFAALLLVAADRRARVIDGFAAQIAGIGAGYLAMVAVETVFGPRQVFWGVAVETWMEPTALAVLAALVIGLAWWRMGEALQTGAGVWVWPLFLAVVGFLAGGHAHGTIPWAAGAFAVLLPIAWLALLADPKHPVAFAAWLRRPAPREAPSWIVAFGVLAVLAALLVSGELDPGLPSAFDLRPDWMDQWDWRVAALPALGFLIRDAALMHLIAWGGLPGRGVAGVLVYLIALYGLLPVILASTVGEHALWLLLPVPGMTLALGLGAPLAQAAVLGVLAWRRLALLVPERRR